MNDDLSALSQEEIDALLASGAADDAILDLAFEMRPTNDDELHAYIHAFYGFAIPRVPVCQGHVAPMEAVADLYFDRYPQYDLLWAGGRGSGKTLDFAITEHLMLSHHGDDIANVGAVDEQAQACYVYIQSFDQKPRFKPNVLRSIISKSAYANGGKLKIIPGTKRQVNGPHPRIALWDEVDQTPWEVLQEGLSMPISRGGRPPRTVFTSSLKYPYGPMVRLMEGADTGRAIRKYTWCLEGSTSVATEHGDRAIKDVAVGDRVWSYDENARAFVLRPVSFAGCTGRDRQLLTLTFEDGSVLECTPEHEILTEASGWRAAQDLALGDRIVSGVGRDRDLGSYASRSLRLVRMERTDTADVYDLTVPGTHNFLANGVVVHNCVFEVIEKCPEERHRNGEGCQECPLASECLDSEVIEDGTISLLPGPGKAARADGFMPIDDVIKKFRTLDKDTWDSQWRSKRPSVKGLIFPMYDENIHVVDYEWNPALPTYCGIDFGYSNPSVAVYCQVLPGDNVVIFAEDYRAMRTAAELGASMKKAPWFESTLWREGDPAAAGDRATLQRMGIAVHAANNTVDPNDSDGGIARIRHALQPNGRPTPLLYIARACVNLRREMRFYHRPDTKEDRNEDERPVKVDDHAIDASRYLMARLFKIKP